MSLSVELEDGRDGTKNTARITPRGQVIVAPLGFSTPEFQELITANTAFNFFGPQPNKKFVMTDVVIGTNKDVTVNGARIEIYTAESATSLTPIKDILIQQIAKNSTLSLTGLNFIIDEGVWINAVTDTTTAFVTIAGYFIDA